LKYQSKSSDWSLDPGWACLKFSLEQPQYYMYTYTATNTTSTQGAYDVTANGDLNGDGTLSTFSISGSVQSGALTTSPTIGETLPEE
jgi:type IV pilus assembly protein PilA